MCITCWVDQIKTIRKTTTGLHYAIFDAQMLMNSSALSLFQALFRTGLASTSISRLICINANALKRFSPIDAQRKVINLFKIILDLSHLHDPTAAVRRIFNNTYIFGCEFLSQTFNTFATESSWFSFGTAFHRLSHLEYSTKAFMREGRSYLYSWISMV